MSGDPEQDYFCDGVVEDIITALSRFKWLFVIARNSTFTYKGRAVDVKQVGRELGVRYVLEGVIRKAGNRVRITGQLIDADDGAPPLGRALRPRSHEASLRFKTRSRECCWGNRARNLASGGRSGRAVSDRQPDAYDLYLRALAMPPPVYPARACSDALNCFDRALALDPAYSAAGRPCRCHSSRYRIAAGRAHHSADSEERRASCIRAIAPTQRSMACVLGSAAWHSPVS